jgi:hypothetical protein
MGIVTMKADWKTHFMLVGVKSTGHPRDQTGRDIGRHSSVPLWLWVSKVLP